MYRYATEVESTDRRLIGKKKDGTGSTDTTVITSVS